jgi:hypothetical protein
MSNNAITVQWQFKSMRVQHGILTLGCALISMGEGENFTKYVRIAVQREIEDKGAKQIVSESGKVRIAKEYDRTQKSDLKGAKLVNGQKEELLLGACRLEVRQLIACDEAFAQLEKAGMLATEFSPLTDCALTKWLGYLASQFKATRQQQPAKPVETEVKP